MSSRGFFTLVFLLAVFIGTSASAAIPNNKKSNAPNNRKLEREKQSLAAEQLALSLRNRQTIKSLSWPQQERPFYGKLVELHMSRQLTDFIAGSFEFLSRYPKSPFADNVVYMRGTVHLSLGKLADAVKDFETIEREYSNSNKAVSASFAKGVAYKKLGVTESAVEVFRRVIRTYPGSSESFRARNELRLMQKAASENANRKTR